MYPQFAILYSHARQIPCSSERKQLDHFFPYLKTLHSWTGAEQIPCGAVLLAVLLRPEGGGISIRCCCDDDTSSGSPRSSVIKASTVGAQKANSMQAHAFRASCW